MSKTETFELTLHLQWGHDGDRRIEVPVEYRKGSYAGRYELYIDGTHIGWVVKHAGAWHAYISSEQNGGYQRQCGLARNRYHSVDEVVARLGDHARTNVLAERAQLAYAQ
jgi:hypothetical protein